MLEQKEEVGSWCIDADDRRTALSSGRSPTQKRRTKEAATQAACAGNSRGYHSEYGNSWFDNRENDDAYYMLMHDETNLPDEKGK